MVRSSSNRRSDNKPYQNYRRNRATVKNLPLLSQSGKNKQQTLRDELKTPARYDSVGSPRFKIGVSDMDEPGFQQDAESESFIPDHCWVGEYLDSEDEKDVVPIAYDKSVVGRTRDPDLLAVTHKKPVGTRSQSIHGESSKKYQPFAYVPPDSSRLSASSKTTDRGASLSPPPPPPLPKKLHDSGAESVGTSRKDILERRLLSSLRTLLVDSDISGALERTVQPVEVYDYGHGSKAQSHAVSQDTRTFEESLEENLEVAPTRTGGISATLSERRKSSGISTIPKKRQADFFSNIPVIVKDRSPAAKVHLPNRKVSQPDPAEKIEFKVTTSEYDRQQFQEKQQDKLSNVRILPKPNRSPLSATLEKMKVQKAFPGISSLKESLSSSSPHPYTCSQQGKEDSMNYIPVHGDVSGTAEFPIEVHTSVCRPRDKKPRLQDDGLGVSPAKTCVELSGTPAIQTQLKIKPVFKKFQRAQGQETNSALITVSPSGKASGVSGVPTTSRNNQNIAYRGSFNDTRKVLLQENKSGRSPRGITPEDVDDRESAVKKDYNRSRHVRSHSTSSDDGPSDGLLFQGRTRRKDKVPVKRARKHVSMLESAGGFPFSKSDNEEELSDKYSDISDEGPIFDDQSDEEKAGQTDESSSSVKRPTGDGKIQSRLPTKFTQKKVAQRAKHFAFKLRGGVRGGPFKRWTGGRNSKQVKKKNKTYGYGAQSDEEQYASEQLLQEGTYADDTWIEEHRNVKQSTKKYDQRYRSESSRSASHVRKGKLHQHQHTAEIDEEMSSGWASRGKPNDSQGRGHRENSQDNFHKSGSNKVYTDVNDRVIEKETHSKKGYDHQLDFNQYEDNDDKSGFSRTGPFQNRVYQARNKAYEDHSRFETHDARHMHRESVERHAQYVHERVEYHQRSERSAERDEEPYEERPRSAAEEEDYYEDHRPGQQRSAKRQFVVSLKDERQSQQRLPWKQHGQQRTLECSKGGRRTRQHGDDHKFDGREVMDVFDSTPRHVHHVRQHRSESRDNLRLSEGENHQYSRSRSRETMRSSRDRSLQRQEQAFKYRKVDAYSDDWSDQMQDRLPGEDAGLERISSGEEFDIDEEETTDTSNLRRTHQAEGFDVERPTPSKRHQQMVERWAQGTGRSKWSNQVPETVHRRERAENRNWDEAELSQPVRQVKSGDSNENREHKASKSSHCGSDIQTSSLGGHSHDDCDAGNLNEPAPMEYVLDSMQRGMIHQSDHGFQSSSPVRSSNGSHGTDRPSASMETRIVISTQQPERGGNRVDHETFGAKQALTKILPGKSVKSPFKPKLKRGLWRSGNQASSPAKEPRMEAINKDTRIIVANDKAAVTNDDYDKGEPPHEITDGTDGTWIGEYMAWFQDTLHSKLSQEQQAIETNLHDPLVFLQSVTKGNKRSMAYIQKGDDAKQMLKFIALNKKYGTSKAVSEKESSGNVAKEVDNKDIPTKDVVAVEVLQLHVQDSTTNICPKKEEPVRAQPSLEIELDSAASKQDVQPSKPDEVASADAKGEETVAKSSTGAEGSDKMPDKVVESEPPVIVSEANNEKSASDRTAPSVKSQKLSHALVKKEVEEKSGKMTPPRAAKRIAPRIVAASKKKLAMAEKQKVVQTGIRKKPPKCWASSIVPPEEAILMAKTGDKTTFQSTTDTDQSPMASKLSEAMELTKVVTSKNALTLQHGSDSQEDVDKSTLAMANVQKSCTPSKSPKAKLKVATSKKASSPSPLRQRSDSKEDKSKDSPLQQYSDSRQDKSKEGTVDVKKSSPTSKSLAVKPKVTKKVSKNTTPNAEKVLLPPKSPKPKPKSSAASHKQGSETTSNLKKCPLPSKSLKAKSKVATSKQSSAPSLPQQCDGPQRDKDLHVQQKSDGQKAYVERKTAQSTKKANVVHQKTPLKDHDAAAESNSTVVEKTTLCKSSTKRALPKKSALQKVGHGDDQNIPKSVDKDVKRGKKGNVTKATESSSIPDAIGNLNKAPVVKQKSETKDKVATGKEESKAGSRTREISSKEKSKKAATKEKHAAIKSRSTDDKFLDKADAEVKVLRGPAPQRKSRVNKSVDEENRSGHRASPGRKWRNSKSSDEEKDKMHNRKVSPRRKRSLERQSPRSGTASGIPKVQEGTRSSRYSSFESTSGHKVKGSSLDHEELISRPKSKPNYSDAHKKLLPVFKQYVENRVIKNLNVLYKFEHYRRLKIVNTANDVLSMFHNEHRKPKFTTDHAVYQIWELFDNPTERVLDEMDKRLQRVHLKKPYFTVSLESLHLFQKTVFQLCYEYLKPNVTYFEQAGKQLRYVRLYAEYLFPQFHGEAVGMMKLWTWSERVYWVLAQKEYAPQGRGSKVPFSSDYVGNSSVKDALADWMVANVQKPLYEMPEAAGCALVKNVENQLQKKGESSTKQIAMLLIIRTWVASLLDRIPLPPNDDQVHMGCNLQESVAEEDGSESDDLVILDEVYSDESDSDSDKLEFEVDLSDEMSSISSVQIIDLF